MSVSLLALKRLIAKDPGLGYASGTCSAAGSTTTITDVSTDAPITSGDASPLWDNAWAEIESDSAGTPLNVGEVRRISGAVGATGTYTLEKALSNATTTTQSYGIYFGVPPTRVGIAKGLDEYINDALRNLTYRTQHLLTLVTDGDMEATGITNWTEVNCDASKASGSGSIFRGAQSLFVVNSGANGYVTTTAIPVAPGETYHCLADVHVDSETEAKLQLYDVTNGAEIASETTTAYRKGYIYLTGAVIPDDCNEVQVRLIGVEADASVYWDNVSLRLARGMELPLPSWFTQPRWLEQVYFLAGGVRSSADDSLAASARYELPAHDWRVIEDPTGATPYWLWYAGDWRGDRHLWIRSQRAYGELSADTDTTTADQDWLAAHVLASIYTDKGDMDLARLWAARARIQSMTHAPMPLLRAWAPLRSF